MKILVNISGGSFPGGSGWPSCESPPMRIQAFSDFGVMTSYCHKDILGKGKSSERTLSTRFVIPTKVSPENPLKPAELFANGHIPQKSKLISDTRTRHGSGSSVISATSSSSSSSSCLSVSKPVYTSRSKTEVEMRRSPSRALEAEDSKRVGSLGDSPKWSRIKEAFEGSELEQPLNKNFSRSTSSLTRPAARQLAAVTVKRTESCDRGSNYRPKGIDESFISRTERTPSRINVDFSSTGVTSRKLSLETLDTRQNRDLYLRTERYAEVNAKPRKTVIEDVLSSPKKSRPTRCFDSAEVDVKLRKTVVEDVLSPKKSRPTKCFDSVEVDVKPRKTVIEDVLSSPKKSRPTRCFDSVEVDVKPRKTVIEDVLSSPKKSRPRCFDSDSETSSLRRNNYRDLENSSRSLSSDTYSSKLSRVRSSRINHSDSEERLGLSKTSKLVIDDSRLARYRDLKCDSETETLNSRSGLPNMDSINSLKSYLKEIQDSKLNRQRYLKSDCVPKGSLSLNVSISCSDIDGKRSKSFLTDSLEVKPTRGLKSSREYHSFVAERESFLDWESKATENYLKKLEETRLGRLKLKKKLDSDLEDTRLASINRSITTRSCSEEPLVRKNECESILKSPDRKVSVKPDQDQPVSNSLALSPRKNGSPVLGRPRSAVSPLNENGATLGKLERGLTFHGSMTGSKNMQGWKMTSSGSWIKVTLEKEVFGSSLKSKVALLAHQFDQMRTSGGGGGGGAESPSKEIMLYKNKDVFDEKPKLSCQSLDAICCPVFASSKGAEEKESPRKNLASDKVITSESQRLSLVKQVVQNFEDNSQKASSSSESETSPTSSKKEELSLQKGNTKCVSSRTPRKNERDVAKGTKGEAAVSKSQRHVSNKDSKSLAKEEREDKTYSSFAGKSKIPTNHKLTIPPRLSSMRNSAPLQSRNSYQRPSVPPPRKPTKSTSDLPRSTSSANDSEGSLLAELERWLVQKYDHKEPKERQPNESFLWKKAVPRQNSESSCCSRNSESNDELPQAYYSRPFAHTVNDGEEHIYMEASFEPPRSTGTSSNEVFVQGSSCDSDEGWVDVDDAELEHIVQEARDSNTEVHIRSRPKSVKTHCVRRSWIQSVRDKSARGKEWTHKDYKDITVWETEEGDASSSSSTNSDHLYEALYDVIMPEETRDQGKLLQTESQEDLASISQDTGINDTSMSCGNLTESNDYDEPDQSAKSQSNEQGLKRNWSLTKSDIRLELTSNLNKVKVRKDVQSTTDVTEPQSDTEVVTSKKKTLIKFILRQKNNAPVKKRAHKKGATFYVRWSKVDRETRGCNGPTSESNEVSAACAGESSEVDGKRVATVKRRPSNPVRRPTTPPPLPPIAGGQVRSHEGTKSLEIVRSASSVSSSSSKDKSKSLDSAQNFKLEQGAGEPLCRNDSFVTRSSYSSSQGSCSPSSSSQSSHDTPNGNSLFLMPKSRGSVASSLSSHSGNSYIPEDEVASIPKPVSLSLPTTREEEVSYLELRREQYEALRSPFEEEPLYQFYTKGVKQRATKLQTLVMMDEEHDDQTCRNLRTGPIDLNLSPVSVSSTSSGIPSAMELLHHDMGNQRTLWCEVPEVRNSGILEQISMQERKLQEAMFEVITSEASYLKSLNVLIDHFMDCPEFSDDFSMSCVLGRRERHVLFSDVIPVQEVSARLLNDLEHRWQENMFISNICDILYEHANKFFNVYVKYCANQVYQDRILKEMKATRPEFISVLQRLESNPNCQGLDMLSFLMLPMQRITRMPLLVDAIFHRLTTDSPHYEICKLTLVTLNKVVAECNEAARKMERMEEMLVISRQLDFKDCKSIPLISASRWLVKKGELVRLVCENSGRNKTFGRSTRYTKIPLYLFLFTDLLLLAKKKSDDFFVVLDYCPRNLVQVFTLEDAGVPMPGKVPESHKNVFQLTMLQNHEFKTVEMILGCPLESDRTRWMEAVTPPVSENPEEKIYEEWDCPQVQCIYPYYAKQPDELTLEESDVVNVFRKMPDGWHEGERLRDGIKGWFPASFTVEIISSHIRARNLRQRYRLLMLSQAYVEEQRKAFLLDKSDKTK